MRRRHPTTQAALSMTDHPAIPDPFDGPVRLFPLPNLVLFPGIDQGLHIFEYRYRQMIADAIASDGLIAPVLLRPDWEDVYDESPPIEPVACLARIVEHERLIDGRFNLRVRGMARFMIEVETPDDDKLYRLGKGRLLPTIASEDLDMRRELRDAVLSRFDPASPAFANLSALFSSGFDLGRVCDQIGYSLPLPLPVKQRLLGEADVVVRVEVLIEALRPPGRHFPPKFSTN